MTLLSTGILPGLRAQIYMHSWNLDCGASEFAPTDEETAKDVARLADTTLDVAFGAPFARCSARVMKRTFSLSFARPSVADLVRLRMLRCYPEDFDFCDWTADAEYFPTPAYGTYDPGTASVAARRNAESVISSGLVPAGDHTAVFIGASTWAEWPVTWGSVDTAAPWHHPFALETMAEGTAEAGWLVYWPVYRVFCNAAAPSFTGPHRESWRLSLLEV